jgi:signal transduction histidine kinase/tetratricopeptide (TPR) repeat protein
MVKISMQHGVSGASAHGCAVVGFILGPVFHRYGEGYRFAKLACDLVEKHGFIAYQAKVYYAMGTVAFWVQPIGVAIDSMRATSRAAIETGDPTFACYGMFQSVTGLLLRNDPLDVVWRESEMALDFAREAKYGDSVDIIRSQQRFIASLQGRTATFSTFSDVQFDEATFEAQLTGDRMTLMIAWYWILKLKARFLSGDYAEALAAADKVKPLLPAAAAQIQLLDYFYYTALTVAACYENASADEQQGWRELLSAHQEQLREWAEAYPPTFADKHALVLAEIARLEGQDADAMRLYELAIRSARDQGFVQNEGVAHELAAGFYLGRGSTTAARAHLEDARSCFVHWGALGKVQQLDQRYPRLREKTTPSLPTATIGTPVEQLDVGTVVKAAQAVSGEIVLDKLIETLMRIALEHAGAERGLLILFPGDEPRIEAEATSGRGRVEITLRQTGVSPAELPESVLHYVIRTRESLILDDAAAPTLFSADAYVRQRRPRSVLCLPLVKQAKLVGALYLENNLTPRAFTSGRIAVLELLASQAAISLENAVLYSDLQRSEAFLADGQRMSRTGSWSWNVSTGKLVWSEEHYRIFGRGPGEEPEPTFQSFLERVHSEDRPFVQQRLEAAIRDRTGFAFDFRIALPDGPIKYLHGVGRPIVDETGDIHEYVGTTMDVSERKRSETALRDAQADLARAARLATMGELTTLIAHEVSQPLMAIVTNADTCLSWLTKASPNLDGARQAAERVVRNGHRAGNIVKSIRALARKSELEMAQFDINDAIGEILVLLGSELRRQNVLLETELSDGIEPVTGDHVQLQQVVLNLVMNGIEAMSAIMHRPRILRVSSQLQQSGDVLIAVMDVGTGLNPANIDRIFDALFTTKPEGVGMGLAICRSIIEAHGGLLWASPQLPHGSVFQFTVPARINPRGT